MMPHAAQVQMIAITRPLPGIYNPPTNDTSVAHWKINGYRASVQIWTVEEWANLAVRPSDAQYYPCGVWCVLKMD